MSPIITINTDGHFVVNNPLPYMKNHREWFNSHYETDAERAAAVAEAFEQSKAFAHDTMPIYDYMHSVAARLAIADKLSGTALYNELVHQYNVIAREMWTVISESLRVPVTALVSEPISPVSERALDVNGEEAPTAAEEDVSEEEASTDEDFNADEFEPAAEDVPVFGDGTDAGPVSFDDALQEAMNLEA